MARHQLKQQKRAQRLAWDQGACKFRPGGRIALAGPLPFSPVLIEVGDLGLRRVDDQAEPARQREQSGALFPA